MYPAGLISKKIKYIFQVAATYLVDFCIRTPGTGYRSKMFVLNIKDFCPEAASRPEFVRCVGFISTFWAIIF